MCVFLVCCRRERDAPFSARNRACGEQSSQVGERTRFHDGRESWHGRARRSAAPMTDYEIADLFFSVVSAANQSFMNYVTLVFAMLAASYLVAHKLDRITTVFAVGLFTAISAGYTFELFSVYSDLSRLAGVIAERGLQAETALGWHGAALANGTGSLHFAGPLMAGIALFGYLGTLIFFFRARSTHGPGVTD
jgi:hypothetical protein